MFFNKEIKPQDGYTMVTELFGINLEEKRILLIDKKYNFSDIISAKIIENSVNRNITSNLNRNNKLYITSNIELINKLDLEITAKDIAQPIICIPFLKTVIRLGVNKNSKEYIKAYKKAQKCLAMLENIINDNKISNNTSNSISVADEIMKFKKLLDDGIITQEEFELKKKELLK